jgi:transketolase
MRDDERILVLTAENRAAIRNVPNLMPERFIDFGIAEMTMIGAAAGLALGGRKPIVHALAAFLTARAYEFIRNDIGIPSLPVIMVGGVPGILSEANGPTHQAIDDISLMRTVPGISIFVPSDTDELVDALPQLINYKKPIYVRMPAAARTRRTHTPFTYGFSEIFPSAISTEIDVTIFTYGYMLNEVLGARDILETQYADT